jgi:hypothetical protein
VILSLSFPSPLIFLDLYSRSSSQVELDFKNGYGAFSTEEDDVVEVNL